jgi:DNA-binding response OmpR family regulator
LDNAVEAVNRGADAYIMKPLNPQELLKTIKGQLRRQQEDLVMTQEKIAEFIETRAKQLKQEREG